MSPATINDIFVWYILSRATLNDIFVWYILSPATLNYNIICLLAFVGHSFCLVVLCRKPFKIIMSVLFFFSSRFSQLCYVLNIRILNYKMCELPVLDIEINIVSL